MTQVRVNVRSVANSAMAKYVTRNGRELVVVPSATLPDDIVMNNVKYPAEEIAKAYNTLERTPAPFGHPMVNGNFVSARDPEGINVGYIGAWNENVRRDNGRVFMDKVIDVEVAQRCTNGKRVLEAIKKGKPMHTSTGLLANLEDSPDAEGIYVARDMVFDHDAILLDEEGAATPSQGVGMFVNGKQIRVINSSIEESIDDQMEWALDSIARTLEQRERMPMVQRLKAAIMEMMSKEQPSTTEKENAEMADDKKGADVDVTARLNALEEQYKGIGDTIANAVKEALGPLSSLGEQVEALTNAAKAKDAEAKAALVNQVVQAGVLSKEVAETMPVEALQALANATAPGKSVALNSSFGTSGDDEFEGYDLNAVALGKEGDK